VARASDFSAIATASLEDGLIASATVEPKARMSIDSAAIQLTDTILGYNERDLADTLKSIARNIGISHIAYLSFAPNTGEDTILLRAVVTYARSWQARYLIKQYVYVDPVVSYGRHAVLPFDWSRLPAQDPAVRAFTADAAKHRVGRHGISIPVRNRHGALSLVSFSSDCSTDEWASYKSANMTKLQQLSMLIDSAANINAKLPTESVKLSAREEQCLILAARGKTFQEAAEILNISFGSMKAHLDTARHKLHCINLTHAVAVAIATGVIPAKALK
jgi:DNA-binding CsgD family transcriptional regulator